MTASPKFFAGLAVGLLTALVLDLAAFGLVLGIPTVNSGWSFEINRRKQELARAVPPPRLLLVGGSSVLFGINARTIERQTGVRTLNLGTHAALGAPYILAQARNVAKSGDTVLLVFEYELYVSNARDDVWLDYLVARDPDGFHSLSLMEQWQVFMLTSEKRLKIGLKNRFNPGRHPDHTAGGGVYNDDCIDSWGDQTGNRRAAVTADPKPLPTQLARGLPEHPASFPAIESFCHWAQENHIRVLAAYPNVLDNPALHTPLAEKTAARLADFYTRIGVPVVGEYTDSLLPADQFFDTVYHLREEAALARTERFVEKLRPYLE
jgi:hypothetical protein